MQPAQDDTATVTPPAQAISPQASLAILENTKPAKTTGEKAFSAIRFMTGEVLILALTAGIAYAARYGPDKVGPIPNVFKKIDEGMKKLLIEKPKPEGRMLRLAGAAVATTTLMWGGNLYVPVRKKLQDNKEAIVTGINQRYGKPGEAEAGAVRLEHETKESWGDIIKGRLGSWAVVFGSFVGVDLTLGKSAITKKYHLENLEEKFGRMIAGMTAKGKEIAKIPLTTELNALQEKNKTYRFGKIMALDIYATAASLVVWDIISRISAKKRHRQDPQHTQPVETHAEHIEDAAADPVDFPVTSRALAASAAHAARLSERPADYRALAQQQAENAAAVSR